MTVTALQRTSSTFAAYRARAQRPAYGARSDLQHVAIVMDGNGRWAVHQGERRLYGHYCGAQRVRSIVNASLVAGIPNLTLFAFSTENWRRSSREVSGLMTLFCEYIRGHADYYDSIGVRARFIGDRTPLHAELRALMASFEEQTSGNRSLNLTLAINYGARDEITRAVADIASAVASGRLDPKDIDQSMLSARLDTSALPDPDLVIRTGGDQRTSNFMLWQAAYAEYAFTETLWPDFDPTEFYAVCDEFRGRQRRFGGTPAAAVVR